MLISVVLSIYRNDTPSISNEWFWSLFNQLKAWRWNLNWNSLISFWHAVWDRKLLKAFSKLRYRESVSMPFIFSINVLSLSLSPSVCLSMSGYRIKGYTYVFRYTHLRSQLNRITDFNEVWLWRALCTHFMSKMCE